MRVSSVSIIASIAFVALTALVAPIPARAATFTVNRIGDQPDLNLANSACDVSSNAGAQCTLRAAIQEANDTPGADVINFNIGGTGNKVIAPSSPLPVVTGRVTINGYSQPGTSVNTRAVGNDAVLRIVLDGINAGVDAVGLNIAANSSTVRGLVIQRWDRAGILLTAASATVSGNFIGTNVAGDVARANGVGIEAEGGSFHIIGGSANGARNLISGNGFGGIQLTSVSNTLVAGNYIGTDRAGAAAVENGDTGLMVVGGRNNVVGRGAGGAANVISGSEQNGVVLSETTQTAVLGNFIGTNAAGTSAIQNGQDGIRLVLATFITIGGTTDDKRNTVSGNQVGISIQRSDDNTIVGNRIGTRADGTGNVGNRFGGVSVTGDRNQIGGPGPAGNIIANTGNTAPGIFLSENFEPVDNVIQGNAIVGNAGFGITMQAGPNHILGNTIAANGDDGINLARFTGGPNAVRISGNSIFANGGLGIDLARLPATATGVDPNDAGDGDAGPNGMQNFPVINSAVRASNGVTTISMSLNSAPTTEYRVELFLAAVDPSGHGEGQSLIASTNVVTNASGNSTFSIPLTNLSAGQQLTATAINELSGDTSEFGQIRTVTQAP